MSKLERMVIFKKVVDTKSFSKAARDLHLSTAAVSKQVKALEEETNTELLIRSAKHFELTQTGQLYYKHCSNIVEQVEEFDNLFAQLKLEPQGRLKVSVGRYFAKFYITPFINEFIKKYPKITLDMDVTERVPQFREEQMDVLIGLSPGYIGQDAIQRKVTETSFILCASPSYIEQYGAPKVPEDLINHKYVTHTIRKPDDVIEFNGKEFTVKPTLYVNDTESMVRCAIQGVGLAKFHDYAVLEYIASGELIPLLTEYKAGEIPICVSYSPTKYVQPKIRAFLNFLDQKLKETPPSVIRQRLRTGKAIAP